MAKLQENRNGETPSSAPRAPIWSSAQAPGFVPSPVHGFQARIAAACLDEAPDDHARWPGAVRLALLGGGVALSWWIAIQFARAIL
ncbi:hypothetical protein ACNFJ7_07240 [Sphingomonas sp. HT-1]|uniref:hypothetical protein n=1 Tax=unclassified Sphingomonas TaxID=196159 RepID=UPI0003176106|nr:MULTISPECIES: hypothetical protein [unclassified Sphingomonas]